MCGVKPVGSSHSTANLEKDLNKVVGELVNTSQVFTYAKKRSHTSVKVHGSIFNIVKKQELLKWMKVRLTAIAT